jgi:arsenical-resistance protein 2
MESLTLEGGMKGWAKSGEEYTRAIDGYDAEYWKQFE